MADFGTIQFERAEAAEAEVKWLRAENGRMRAALEAGSYYIERMETSQRGAPVRDMDEACCAWRCAKRRVTDEQSTMDIGREYDPNVAPCDDSEFGCPP